jgi:uncharacterized protein YegL
MWHERFHPDPIKSPHYAMNASFPGMMAAIDRDVTARAIAHISVIAFSDGAEVVTPLSKVIDGAAENPIYALPKGGQTNYALAFKTLNQTIRSDVSALTSAGKHVKGPAVFFLTDGEPQVGDKRQLDEVWQKEWSELTDPLFEHRPRIVSLGLGSVNERTLKLVASKVPPGAACIAEPGVTAGNLLGAIIDIIIFSITQSTNTGSFVFDTPLGMRRVF